MLNPSIHPILFNSCYLYAKWRSTFDLPQLAFYHMDIFSITKRKKKKGKKSRPVTQLNSKGFRVAFARQESA